MQKNGKFANCRTIARRFAGVCGAWALLAMPALAADLVPEQVPEPPSTVETDVFLWSGAYAGLYGDYGWMASTIENAPDVDGIDGIGGGFYAGYNHQFASNWVAGLEGTAGYSGLENSFAGHTVEQNWDASLRGRMGYAFENSMIYGLAGLAGTSLDVSDGSGGDSKVHLGWQIGAGLETFLTKNVAARIEYNYSDYAARTHSLGAGNSDVDATSHAMKVGIGFKF